MVLDYRFITEQDIKYLLMTLVDEEQRFILDYNQVLNSAREIKDYYVFNLPDGEVRVNKTTGEVVE